MRRASPRRIVVLTLGLGLAGADLLAGQADANEIVDPAHLSALSYRSVGPYRGGRVTAVAGVRSEPYMFYMGSTGGGVYKTDDAGVTWRNISDGQIPIPSIGAIAVAPSDANVVYVGTGSAEPRGNTSPGRGLFKSTDAGKTWTPIGLEDAGQVGRIVVHPTDADVLFVAALGNLFGNNDQRGVFRSDDGGETWENVLFVNDSTGVVDIAINPRNPRILYATPWRAQRLPWTMISGSSEGGIYRSKDGGDSWSKLGVGLPTGLVGKTGVTVSPANPDRVWAVIEAEGEAGGVYRSDNGGDSWRQLTGDRQLWHRPWYYNRITADPQDENTVWINNVLLYKSVDGGMDWTPVPTVPHPDSHALWINPDNTDIMIEGDDGGATVSLNGGRSWSTQRNQATAELYRVTVDNQFPYRLYGAQQDNSTVSVPSRVPGAMISDFEQEYQVGGCESGHIAVDPRDPNIVYSGCFGGSINRYDVRTGNAREILAYPQNQLAQRVGDLRYRFQWNAPIRISPHDPDVLYHASNHLHRSNNGGQSWDVISPDLTTNNPDHQGFAGGPITSDGTGVEVYGTIFAFEESPDEAGVLWTGSDDGQIHVSRDNGASWSNVTPDAFPMGATVNSIDISRHLPGRVHVAAYKYRQNDMRPYVFQTNDYGASWSLLTTGSNGIPDDYFVRVVREDPERRGLLYAGTEFGMFVSINDGQNWQSLQRNLPATPVTDIVVHEGDLVLSTQGRSFWIMDDLTPLRVWTDAPTRAATLHEVEPAIRAFFGGPGLGAIGASSRATNPPDGAWFHYTLGEAVEGSVELTVIDASGDTAATFSSEEQAGPDLGAFAELAAMFGFGGGGALLPKGVGTHRATWGLTYPAPTLPQGTIIFGALATPPAPPGQYTVTLTVEGEEVESQTFEVLPDPRVPTTRADYIAQHQFLQDLGSLIDRMADNTGDLVSVRSQVEGIVDLSGEAGLSEADEERLEAAADSLTGDLTALQEEIQQTDNRSFYDPLDNPGKLAAELAFLYNTVAGGFGGTFNDGPTDQAVERLEELRAQVNDVLGRLESVLDEDLAAFNALIRSLGLEPVIVSKPTPVIS